MSNEHEAIRALTYEYTFRLDRGDFAGVADLLAHGELRMAARGMHGDAIRGADEIERFYSDQVVTYDGNPRTRHLITNHIVEIGAGGECATGRCYFTVLMQTTPLEPIQAVVSGRYSDSFRRADGAWQFASKTIEVDYFNSIGDHFTIDDRHSETR